MRKLSLKGDKIVNAVLLSAAVNIYICIVYIGCSSVQAKQGFRFVDP
jgi:hypothetical protein